MDRKQLVWGSGFLSFLRYLQRCISLYRSGSTCKWPAYPCNSGRISADRRFGTGDKDLGQWKTESGSFQRWWNHSGGRKRDFRWRYIFMENWRSGTLERRRSAVIWSGTDRIRCKWKCAGDHSTESRLPSFWNERRHHDIERKTYRIQRCKSSWVQFCQRSSRIRGGAAQRSDNHEIKQYQCHSYLPLSGYV